VLDQLSNIDPARTAVLYGEHKIDYARFSSDVDDMAAWLLSQELVPGLRVGIIARHPYWDWIAYLAALRLGLTVATLTPKYREEISAAGRLDVWLGVQLPGMDNTLAERFVPFNPQNMRPLSSQLNFVTRTSLVAQPEGAQAGRLTFTSGTTGRPKAIFWDERSLRQRIEVSRSSQGITADTVMMVLLGIDTTAGFRYPLAVWGTGGTILLRALIAGTARTSFTRKSINACNLLVVSPARLQRVLGHFPEPWEGRETRKVVVPGGRLPQKLRDTALRIAAKTISVAYGATETGSIATGDSTVLDRHPGAVGFALEGTSVEIVDADDNKMPAGETGIVRTRTDHMAQEYVTPLAGKSPFRDGWFYPGDEGIMFEDGLLAITGRLSEIINLSGWKVATPDLEARLSTIPAVRDVCAIMLKLARGDVLALATVCDDGVNAKAMWRQFRSKIPQSVPVIFVRMRELPRNAMGKFARPQIERQLTQLIEQRVRPQE
jgi:acyl-CoA synthetase (AMP-forming)/AMP-acid ligase II